MSSTSTSKNGENEKYFSLHGWELNAKSVGEGRNVFEVDFHPKSKFIAYQSWHFSCSFRIGTRRQPNRVCESILNISYILSPLSTRLICWPETTSTTPGIKTSHPWKWTERWWKKRGNIINGKNIKSEIWNLFAATEEKSEKNQRRKSESNFLRQCRKVAPETFFASFTTNFCLLPSVSWLYPSGWALKMS